MKNVKKYLDAGTGCLPADEYQQLEDGLVPVVTTEHSYGIWVAVPSKIEHVDIKEQFPALHAVMECARAHGCNWINFDRDADSIPDLPWWDW